MSCHLSPNGVSRASWVGKKKKKRKKIVVIVIYIGNRCAHPLFDSRTPPPPYTLCISFGMPGMPLFFFLFPSFFI